MYIACIQLSAWAGLFFLLFRFIPLTAAVVPGIPSVFHPF